MRWARIYNSSDALGVAAEHLSRPWAARSLPAAPLPVMQGRLHPSAVRPCFGCLHLTSAPAVMLQITESALILLPVRSSLRSAASLRPKCCVLQAVDRCLHYSNLQDNAAGAWAGKASSEADSSSAAGDCLSASAASQGTAGWAQAGPELWPLDDSEKLRVRSTMHCQACSWVLPDAFRNFCALLHHCCYPQSTWGEPTLWVDDID